jgi:beta-glucanase (GH16 family)
VPPTTAPPATVPAVTPLFAESWDQGLRLSSNRARSTWMPVDYGWQSQPALASNERGYEDFAGNSWNVNPNRDPGQTPFSVVDGRLRIQASRIPSSYLTGTGGVRDQMAAQGQDVNNLPTWMGGILISERSFLNGYIEATVTFDAAHAGRGMFPALWLYAAGGSTDVQGKGGAEIDLMEAFGTTSQYSSTIHFIDSSNREVRPSRSTDFSRSVIGTHTYALDWQPTYLRFYFDGQMVWEVTGADAAWFNTPMRLRMNYSMDAPWFGSGRRSDATTPATLWMDVDDVRVWATKP